MDNNQPPSRDDIRKAGFNPVDPAFIPPNKSKPPTSSDIKEKKVEEQKKEPNPDKNLNLKEFPEFEDPEENNSETKRVMTIGGIIIAVLFITSGILYIVTKSKQSDQEPPAAEDNDTASDDAAPADDTTDDTDDTIDDTIDDSADDTIEDDLADDEIGVDGVPKDTAEHKYVTVSSVENPLELLDQYRDDVYGEEVEVSFYNKNGEELTLSSWADQSKITIPGYVNDIITSKYRFFLVKAKGSEAPKAVLILESIYADFRKTESIMKRWEGYMASDLKEFILIGEDFDLVTGLEREQFRYSNDYSGGRYLNMLKDGSVSLNYIIMRDKIIITNNFDAFEQAVNFVKLRRDL